MPGVVVHRYHPSAARFLLDTHRHGGPIYRCLTPDALLHLSRPNAEPLHILHLVRPVLNSHEHTSRPVGVNPFLLFRCGQVPIPDPLAELAGGKILELRHVQHATGQLHIPIPFSAV